MKKRSLLYYGNTTDFIWGGYDMKSELTIQYAGKDSKESDLVAMAKDAFKAAGNKVSDIKKLDLYVQPENSKVYYVVNDDFNGEFQI